ncbi:hypothetical protein F485_gp178 [Aeromonas phage CC2]|uniref:Uncharacterized protein n=1 Tax=Aeromonas phage CC2 TaxID=1204516 RepID=I6WBR1_9CAUD|nr:hypothetical protein F485_gp178 [Aeromonas phage CC2]AFN39350.1 hypothetical protein CC2_117 [Aeromonas phage CC2]
MKISKEEVGSYISTVFWFTAKQGIDNTNGVYGVDGIVEKHNRYLFCIITLKNGLVFHGVNSGGLDPEKYDRKYAENDAFEDAFNKVWEAVAIHKSFSK